MTGFNNAIQILASLQNYFKEVQEQLLEAEKDPESLLINPILQFDTDRNYILQNLASCFGAEGIVLFYSEYFDKVIHTLAQKIPIDEIEIVPEFYNEQYVLVGIINGEIRMTINTFTKEIYYIDSNVRNIILNDIQESAELIQALEQQLNIVSLKQSGSKDVELGTMDSIQKTLNKKGYAKKMKGEANTLIAQLGAEKQQLARLKSQLEEYDEAIMSTLDLRNKYASRLKTYYNFKVMNAS